MSLVTTGRSFKLLANPIVPHHILILSSTGGATRHVKEASAVSQLSYLSRGMDSQRVLLQAWTSYQGHEQVADQDALIGYPKPSVSIVWAGMGPHGAGSIGYPDSRKPLLRSPSDGIKYPGIFPAVDIKLMPCNVEVKLFRISVRDAKDFIHANLSYRS